MPQAPVAMPSTGWMALSAVSQDTSPFPYVSDVKATRKLIGTAEWAIGAVNLGLGS